MTDTAAHSLVELGFTELEAKVYLCLLGNAPLTGYAVAKAICKPTANTYQAIESLIRKQAIIVDEGDARLCKAEQPARVLNRLQSEFDQRRQRAQAAVESLPRETSDNRIYQLRTVAQVFERAEEMINTAQQVVVADLFPGPVERLGEALTKAAANGVTVCVHTYQPVVLPGVKLSWCEEQAYALEAWPGAQISLVADARQHLYGLLDADMNRVHQAIWSESLYLSCMAHNHLAIEFEVAGAEDRQQAGIQLIRNRLPGFQRLAAVLKG